MNDNYMKKKHGQKVNFGDIIQVKPLHLSTSIKLVAKPGFICLSQLFHVKSGKYLTIVPEKLAKVERENIHVMLDVNGSALSWLQIYPRFKIDKEGDRVISNAEMYLRVAERSNEFLHSADRVPYEGHHREVNCALESTSWRLKRFQSSSDALESNILLASQLVTISDPETRTHMTIARRPLESLDVKLKLDKPQHIKSFSDFSAIAGQDEITKSPPRASPVMMDEPHEFFHKNGDIILEPIPPQDVLNSNHLWVIEASSMYDGGPIKWRADQVRFRHVNTGQYLVQTVAMVVDDETEEESEQMVFTTTSHPSAEGTLFSINELNSTTKNLSHSKALQIGHAGVWIERGDLVDDSVFEHKIKGTKDKVNALSLMIHKCTIGRSTGKGEEEMPEGMGSHDPLDVFSGLAARNYLRKYHDMTEIPRSDAVNTIWPSGIRTDLEFFQLVVEKTVFFSQGFPISAVGIQLGIDKADAVVRVQRQNLLREQDTLEVVLRMINKLIPITEKLEHMRRTTTTKRKKSVRSDEEQQMVAMGQLVLSKCFNLLYYSILDNQENQIYVADHMPILLAHLNAQPLAGNCVTEMLSKNIELQETKIGTREIQIFVDKLRSSKMNAMYLQLLQACCSCQGQGVDGNQCKVANMLFTDTNDIIINMHADYSRAVEVTWQQPSLYIPPGPIPGSPVAGDRLLKSLPTLSLAWTTNSIDFSPLGLFGKLSVNVQDLYKKRLFELVEDPRSNAAKKLNKSKKKSTQEQKDAVANYFIAELFLGAEMCMDRNYVAMHKLDELFTYEMLVAIIKMDVSSGLKSAAVRLLMCLYVDRDPQASSKIPLLTRTWSDIKKSPEPRLPYVDSSRRFTFGLIQQMISEHVVEMADNRWDELSRHMLKMLRTMVSFNFYGTNERMQDVIGPLIRALDRRKVPVIETEMPSLRKKKSKILKAEKEREVASKKDLDLFGNPDDTKEEEKYETENIESFDDQAEFQDDRWYKRWAKGCYRFCANLANMNQAAKVLVMDDEGVDGTAVVEGFRTPLRYSKAPIYELETMVEAVDILAFAQRVIEDRNVSLLLRYFYQWETNADKRTPAELFEQVMVDSKALGLGVSGFDEVMLDVLMFVHMPLMQSTLEVLMAHYSTRRILLDNASNVQLVASYETERKFTQIDQTLQQLQQNAEMHELWGVLETDKDRMTNESTKKMLSELIDYCRVRRTVLEFDEDFAADPQIQDMYRNLGCFEICMKFMGLLDSVEEDEDGNFSEEAENTRHLCLLVNTLLYWYFLGNPKNQHQGFGELEMFLETLDMGINSHLIIKAIFKNNEALMRLVPHSTLSELVDRISKVGRSHHYLTLFASISHVGEKNIAENQFEIVKSLTSPGCLKKVSCFLCPVESPEYEEKREQMKLFAGDSRDLALDDLPPLLAYHLMFLEVLSGCTVGRLNITTVEAKVQSVFNNFDIVSSILDPDTILVAKIIMSKFLFNAVIEVELVIPGLEKAGHIWKLLDSYQAVLATAKADFVHAALYGFESPEVSRQRLEYIIVSIMIINGFFGHYYDDQLFRGSDPIKGGGDKQKRYTARDVKKLITTFFYKIKEVYDLESPILSEEMKTLLQTTLETLKKRVPAQIHTAVVPRVARAMSMRGANSAGSSKPGSPLKPSSSARQMLITTPNEKNNPANSNGYSSGGEEDSPSKRGRGASPTKKSREESERRLIAKYQDFVGKLSQDHLLQDKADNENVGFISILEGLPYISDAVQGDVRYETLIRKLVFHIRENISIVNGQKRLDPRVTTTSAWIIKAFRTMIENKMGMSIFQRDEEGGQEQDDAAAPVVNALNSCGATALCLDLIADGIDEALQMEAVKLGVGLLFKEGGALAVQKFMHNHLCKTQSDLFFKQVRLTLQKLQAWHVWADIIVLEDGEEPAPPPEILIVRFLQLMCEGHYLPNQDIMREQPTNATSYNLLDDFVSYFNALSRLPCRTSTTAAIRLSATILEVIQGPCEGNQAHFALNTELIETLNRINRAKLIKDCVEEEEIELKKTSIDIFQGLLEGQGEKSVVYERVLSVIHLDIIQMMSKGVTLPDAIRADGKLAPPTEPSEDQEILQTECMVLLQMLCNFKPSLYDELGISRNIEDIVGSGTAMIEIVWRGDIHRRFFHVPAVCNFLAKSSKDALVENVDRSNSENKLIDFLARSHDLYREVKHQQLLTDMGLSRIFSRKMQDTATWITFFIAVVINLLFIAFYKYPNSALEPEVVSSPALSTIDALNIVQNIVACFVIIMNVVVRSPVIYQSLMAEDDMTQTRAILYTALDAKTLYFGGYLVLSLLGLLAADYFLPFLLLDLVAKNATTRDVLNAVVIPYKQLGMTIVLGIFFTYIFSYFIVSRHLTVAFPLHCFTNVLLLFVFIAYSSSTSAATWEV